MFEHFLRKIRIPILKILNPIARAGKKEGGWGEGIFARPRFSAAAEFRASETGAPPINYLKIKTPAMYEQKFITTDNANSFFEFCCRTNFSNRHSTKTTTISKNIIIIVFI